MEIGVIIDDRLKFSEHTAKKVSKANKVEGTIKKAFTALDADIFKQLYVALVCPHLEFANQVWSPYLVKGVEALEKVQQRATRILPNMKHLTYEEKLLAMNLPSLSYRSRDLTEA